MVGRNINDDVSLAYLLKRNKDDAIRAAEEAISSAEISPENMNAILNKVYPVGAVYTSVSSTSPASIFGGTWEQLQNRFLLAAGTSYTAGATGGEASHTLSVDEIPSHNHSVGAHAHGLNSHVHSVGAHAHGLNSHTHTIPAHGHGFTQPTVNGGTCTISSSGAHGHNFATTRNIVVTQSSGWGTIVGGYTTLTDVISGGNHTHTVPNHTHTVSGGKVSDKAAFTSGQASGNTANSTAFNSGQASGSTANSSAFDSGSKGGGTAHNNMPPYLVVYMWKRTA